MTGSPKSPRAAALLAPRARQDLLAAAGWIAKDDPAAARAFREAVVAAAARIGAYPEIGILRPDLADPPSRFLVLTGFPYVMVYTPVRRPPLILRLLHGARDLGAAMRE